MTAINDLPAEAGVSDGRRPESQDLAPDLTDPDAFAELYRQHVVAIERFIARRTQDPHLVADLTAEVFVAAIQSAPTYQPSRGSPTAWLYGIARNVIAAQRRCEARRLDAVRRLSGRAVLDSCGEQAVERLTERIDAQRAARDLLAHLEGMGERTRAVFELVDLDGLAVGEAADLLGISHTAARVRLHRARRSLHDRVPSPGTHSARTIEGGSR